MHRLLAACLLAASVVGACIGGPTMARRSTDEHPAIGARPSTEPVLRTPPAQAGHAAPTPPLTAGEPSDVRGTILRQEVPRTVKAAIGEAVVVGLDGEPWARLAVSDVVWTRALGSATPSPGWRYLAVKVSYEALEDHVYHNSLDWRVTFKGRAARQLYPERGVAPRLRSGVLAAGQVTSGWAYFLVPTRGRVVVGFVNEDGGQHPSLEVVVRSK